MSLNLTSVMNRLSITGRCKSGLYTYLSLIIIILLHFLTSNDCKGQMAFSVSRPRLQIANDNLVITYDILGTNSKDRFYVWLEITDSTGAKINAYSLTGDIGDSIKAGVNKQIFWNLLADSIFINNTINIEIIAEKSIVPEVVLEERHLTEKPSDLNKTEDISNNEVTNKVVERPEIELSRVKVGNHLLQSTIFPGWGLSRLSKGKPYWLFGVAGVGCITASVYFNLMAHSSYNDYLESPDNDIKGYYDDAISQGNYSKAFAWSAAAIWIVDLGIVGLKASRMNRAYRKSKSSSFSVSPSFDIKTDTQMLSLYYNF